MNGIGKLFSIIGSNVKLNVQLVEYDETPTKVGNVRNFQDNAGTDKIQVILPINNNMRACWIFNDKFNMTERDPIICQYKTTQSNNTHEYPIKTTPYIRNSTFWSLNFPIDATELRNCKCTFWSPNNESLYNYTLITSTYIKSVNEEKASIQWQVIIFSTFSSVSILLVLLLLAFCFKCY